MKVERLIEPPKTKIFNYNINHLSEDRLDFHEFFYKSNFTLDFVNMSKLRKTFTKLVNNVIIDTFDKCFLITNNIFPMLSEQHYSLLTNKWNLSLSDKDKIKFINLKLIDFYNQFILPKLELPISLIMKDGEVLIKCHFLNDTDYLNMLRYFNILIYVYLGSSEHIDSSIGRKNVENTLKKNNQNKLYYPSDYFDMIFDRWNKHKQTLLNDVNGFIKLNT